MKNFPYVIERKAPHGDAGPDGQGPESSHKRRPPVLSIKSERAEFCSLGFYYRPQSFSASRFTAGAFGFLTSPMRRMPGTVCAAVLRQLMRAALFISGRASDYRRPEKDTRRGKACSCERAI